MYIEIESTAAAAIAVATVAAAIHMYDVLLACVISERVFGVCALYSYICDSTNSRHIHVYVLHARLHV